MHVNKICMDDCGCNRFTSQAIAFYRPFDPLKHLNCDERCCRLFSSSFHQNESEECLIISNEYKRADYVYYYQM